MTKAPLIALFTDFGLQGPYMGQMRAAIATIAPNMPVIDLFADAPMFNAMASAYLLAAYGPAMPQGSIIVAVVDPGVGSARPAVILQAGGRFYVGPDNGLLAVMAARDGGEAWVIDWVPPNLSNSFHGRDLFAPVAARLAIGQPVEATHVPLAQIEREDWPDDLPQIIYHDHYGNVMTGLRASCLSPGTLLRAGGHEFRPARTFSAVSPGQAFWYENSNGLAEIAVNQGRAADLDGLGLGAPISFVAA